VWAASMAKSDDRASSHEQDRSLSYRYQERSASIGSCAPCPGRLGATGAESQCELNLLSRFLCGMAAVGVSAGVEVEETSEHAEGLRRFRADGSLVADSAIGKSAGFLVSGPITVLRRLFIPSGPVSPDYFRFQLADSVQATCSYLRGVLAVHATLTGAGLSAAADGSAGTTAALATVTTFILKDGSAMLGSLAFSYLAAHLFDGELRFWRLFADVINDVGLTVELLAPLAGPRWFLPVTCCANVCKALCGVAAGATRVSIAKHFAVHGSNVAEVQAKEGAQETAITLLGLLLGLMLAGYLNSSPLVQWSAFTLLTALHVAANYYAVRCLHLRTLNRTRLGILLRPTMPDGLSDPLQPMAAAVSTQSQPLHPAAVAALEPAIPAQYARRVANAACCGRARLYRAICCGARPAARDGAAAFPAAVPAEGSAGWLAATAVEPCRSIRIGVPWRALHSVALTAARQEALCAAAGCACSSPLSHIAAVQRGSQSPQATPILVATCVRPLSVSEAVSGLLPGCSRQMQSGERVCVAVALPPGCTPAETAAVYAGVVRWRGSSATVTPPASNRADSRKRGCKFLEPGRCSAGTLDRRRTIALAHSIADAFHGMPALLPRLCQAGWDTESAGALSMGDEGSRVTLIPTASNNPRVKFGAEAATAAKLPLEGAVVERGVGLPPLPSPVAENVPRRRRQRAGSEAESRLLRASS